jgi:hypothetical protein
MTTDTEPLRGELVPIDQPPAAPVTLFGTSDPRLALERMAEIATALVDVIDTKKLYARINGKKHITVEGWTTLGGMLGVVPVVIGTRPNDTGDGIVATVEARTLDGRVVGAAEGECSRAESKWKNRDPFAIRSMAQTRAISRALRAPLGQIIVLAGYDATPAEEMPLSETESIASAAAPSRGTILQRQTIGYLFSQLKDAAPQVDWASQCSAIAGVPSDELSERGAEAVIVQMRAWLAELGDADAS